MSLVGQVWNVLEGNVTSGFSKAKNEIRGIGSEVKLAQLLIQSAEKEQQREGLNRLKSALGTLRESRSWKYIASSRKKSVKEALKLLDEIDREIDRALAEFDNKEQWDVHLKEIEGTSNMLVKNVTDYLAPGFTSTLTFKALALLVPTVLAFFSGEFIKGKNELVVESMQIVHPLGQFEEDDKGHYQPTLTYSNFFWENFPDYYFKSKEPEGASKNWQMGVQDSMLFKLILKNPSESFPLLVSTLKARIILIEEKPFEWSKLSKKPELDLRPMDSMNFYLTCESASPAVNVQVKMVAGTQVLHCDTLDVLSSTEQLYPFVNYKAWAINDQGRFIEHDTLYVEVDKSHVATVKSDRIVHGGRLFERVINVQRLEELTGGQVVKDIQFNLTYESLKGKKLEKTFKEELSYAFFVHAPNWKVGTTPRNLIDISKLIDFHELEEVHQLIQASKGMLKVADRAYTAFGGEAQTDPQGAGMIKEFISVNGSDLLTAGSIETKLKHVDQVLNPKGFVVLMVSLKAPANGKYLVDISMNENDPSSFFIETLIPDESSFWYPSSLQYFRDTLSN